MVVLGNVNGGAPGQMGGQLVDVVLGKPVTLANERKAVPITKVELAKFVGVFDLSPTFSMTFEIYGDTLMGQGIAQAAPLPLMYIGVKDGHPRFFVAQVNAEFEFVPDAAGVYTSIVLHQDGHDTPRPSENAECCQIAPDPTSGSTPPGRWGSSARSAATSSAPAAPSAAWSVSPPSDPGRVLVLE